jgi:hypothetical protein
MARVALPIPWWRSVSRRPSLNRDPLDLGSQAQLRPNSAPEMEWGQVRHAGWWALHPTTLCLQNTSSQAPVRRGKTGLWESDPPEWKTWENGLGGSSTDPDNPQRKKPRIPKSFLFLVLIVSFKFLKYEQVPRILGCPRHACKIKDSGRISQQ